MGIYLDVSILPIDNRFTNQTRYFFFATNEGVTLFFVL
jgi:hypothetical protein